MSVATLLVLLLAAPPACPPEVGQTRWDGFTHTLGSGDRTWGLSGTLWDRDTDGRPSAGDLFRLDALLRGPRETGAAPTFFLLGPALAADFEAGFAKQKALRAACESPAAIGRDMQTLKTAAALDDFLQAHVGDRPVEVSNEDRTRADLERWAQEICRSGPRAQKALEDALVERGRREGPRLKLPVLRGLARDVAARFALACSHLDTGP